MTIKGAIKIDKERCKGCNLCVIACPKNLLRLSANVNHKGYNYAEQPDYTECNGCTACAICCPDACITVYRVKRNG